MKTKLFSAAAVLLLLAACGGEPAKQQQQLQVTFVFGQVLLDRGTQQNIPLRAGMQVTQQDTVRTVGDSSRCNLQSPGGSVFRLSGATTLKLELLFQDNKLKHEKTGIALLTGKVLVRAKKLVGGEELKVRTKTAVAGVRGTQFVIADHDGKTAIAVKEGRVRVARRITVTAPQLDKKQQTQVNKTLEEATGVDINPSQQVVINEQDNRKIKQQIEQQLTAAGSAPGQKSAPIAVKDLVRNTVQQTAAAAPAVQTVATNDKAVLNDFEEFKHTAPVKLQPAKKADAAGQQKTAAKPVEAVLRITLANRDSAEVTVTPGSTLTLTKGQSVELRFPAGTAVTVTARAEGDQPFSATPDLAAGKTVPLQLVFTAATNNEKKPDKAAGQPAVTRPQTKPAQQQSKPVQKQQPQQKPVQKQQPKGQTTKIQGQNANIGFQNQ